MREFSLQIKIDLLTSFQIQTGYGRKHLDSVVVRNSKNELMIPASTMKGRIRHYVRQFESILKQGKAPAGISGDPSSQVVTRIFGSGIRQGSFYFEEGKLTQELAQLTRRKKSSTQFSEERTNIQINRSLGSTSDQSLRFYEASPKGLSFLSRIDGELEEKTSLQESQELFYLLGALKLFNKLGADKSRGNGSVVLIPKSLQFFSNANHPELVWDENKIKTELELFVKKHVQDWKKESE